jgi:hypothetical protein
LFVFVLNFIDDKAKAFVYTICSLLVARAHCFKKASLLLWSQITLIVRMMPCRGRFLQQNSDPELAKPDICKLARFRKM